MIVRALALLLGKCWCSVSDLRGGCLSKLLVCLFQPAGCHPTGWAVGPAAELTRLPVQATCKSSDGRIQPWHEAPSASAVCLHSPGP
jgi:hypothetical protein